MRYVVEIMKIQFSWFESSKTWTHSKIVLKLDTELGGEDADENGSVYMDMDNCNEAAVLDSTPAAATADATPGDARAKQSTAMSPPIDSVSSN